MKRAFLFLLLLNLVGGYVLGDYSNPPGWENDPYFTHQSWSFGTITTSGEPIAPDDGYINPGTPTLTFGQANWVDDMGTVFLPEPPYTVLGTRQGGWEISGPQENTTWLTIEIPNIANSNMQKEVWFELTFRVSDFELANAITSMVSFNCYADGIIDNEHKFSYFDENGYPIGIDAQQQVWLRYEGKFSFDTQPGSETLILTGSLGEGQSVVLDQIDVDTHCIPEPTTLGLLGIGALGLLRRRS
ncbi:MAG: PEP-CTERM sorting domain-containing protein [Sedimentisphaerales bacterium]|nr:PEP-CTERM sorting domain-containing protein [Sedimentisphaerales bacterium]